ncbi:MAG: tetratricopeptide repeat protein [Syntrophobacteraceae bacterium]|nr:tetratricopeptide repeat protein [Syntrophobacteraceae bacterium]
MRRAGLAWAGAGLAVILSTGCAPRQVAVPPDWRTPPAQAARSIPPAGFSQAPPAASMPGEPILKPTPSFREGNLPAGQEPAAPQAMKKQEPAAPQQLASMHLVEQARTALGQGKPDAAIPLLEQAIQIDAYNGEAFFGLARAWRMKGSRNKAQEFAQKAEVLLQDQPSKLKEVYSFQADLFKELGDSKRMEQYRQKGSKL